MIIQLITYIRILVFLKTKKEKAPEDFLFFKVDRTGSKLCVNASPKQPGTMTKAHVSIQNRLL